MTRFISEILHRNMIFAAISNDNVAEYFVASVRESFLEKLAALFIKPS